VFVGCDALSTANKIYLPDISKLRVYQDVIFNDSPLLKNLKRRHTILEEELEEWDDLEELADEDEPTELPVPTTTPLPVPVPPRHFSKTSILPIYTRDSSRSPEKNNWIPSLTRMMTLPHLPLHYLHQYHLPSYHLHTLTMILIQTLTLLGLTWNLNTLI
jgi:hypothetical protein